MYAVCIVDDGSVTRHLSRQCYAGLARMCRTKTPQNSLRHVSKRPIEVKVKTDCMYYYQSDMLTGNRSRTKNLDAMWIVIILQEDMSDQLVKEAVLAYTMLFLNIDRQLSQEELDDLCEKFLETQFGLKLDFAVEDAIPLLLQWGMVQVRDMQLNVQRSVMIDCMYQHSPAFLYIIMLQSCI